ncbi:MAG: protein kinase, partial [Candidatus Aminicenantes bacterium]|nr:protein kinase [Candidatus Aminicenantes bacterium]
MINVCPKCQAENPSGARTCIMCGVQLDVADDMPIAHTKTAESTSLKLKRGTVFANRYEVIEELGHGGMGRVYRVEDKKTKEELAFKFVNPHISSDQNTIERFARELTIAHQITHKSVCRMHHLGEEKGHYYITMEYVKGEDLKSFIKRAAPLSTARSLSIAKQVCEGLAEAHKLGVVHRDLKPSNIMIDKEGNVRIMDFGIARSVQSKGLTGRGVMIGTPEYMSPEQVEAKDVDQWSDIYSLGVVLYEMTTGKLPFEADTPFAVGVKQKSEAPKEPRELNPQIPDDLNRVILRCLEKDRNARYQSAEELCSELDKIEKGLPTTDRIVPKKKPLTSREITVTLGLKKLFVPALVVLALALVAVVVWIILPSKQAVPPPLSGKPSLAVMYFKNNTGEENFDIWRSALSDSIITDLSQSQLIHVLSRDRLFSILKKLDLLKASTYGFEDLRKVAEEGKVNHILQGTLSSAGETFRIEYTLQDIRSGKTIGSERVEGKGEESIFAMVDEMTRRVKADFNLTTEEIAGDLDK